MATARNRSHKHLQLDSVKIKRAQRALRAKTETEAIELALDLAISEDRKNRYWSGWRPSTATSKLGGAD